MDSRESTEPFLDVGGPATDARSDPDVSELGRTPVADDVDDPEVEGGCTRTNRQPWSSWRSESLRYGFKTGRANTSVNGNRRCAFVEMNDAVIPPG